LSSGDPYGALSETGCHCFGGKVPTPLALLRFKISKTSDRLAGDIDPNILCRSVRIPDESCYAAGVEDAIKITTGGLGRLAVFDLELVGIVS
jgi:hypothetical protein